MSIAGLIIFAVIAIAAVATTIYNHRRQDQEPVLPEIKRAVDPLNEPH